MRTETYEGIWGLPGLDLRVAGALKTHPDEMASLILTGSLKSPAELTSPTSYPVIHGLTSEGKLITLIDCVETQSSVSRYGYPTQQLATQRVLVGGLFGSGADITAREVYVEISRLADWIGDVGLRLRLGNPDETDEVVISRERITLPTVDVGGTVISFVANWEVDDNRGQSKQLRVVPSVSFSLAHALSIADLLDQWIAPLVNLMTLATSVPCAVTRIKIRSDQAETRHPNELVDLILPMKPVYDPLQGETLVASNMLFTMGEIGQDLEMVVRGWYRASDELRDVAGRYFGTRYGQTYVDTRFLALAQAVEILHRRQHPGGTRPKKDFQKLVTEIVLSAPQSSQAWLRDQLCWANELTLRDRLAQLVATMPAVIDPIAQDRQAFIDLLVDTRNYLTHSDQRLASKAATGGDLYWLNERLGVLIQAGLLIAVGLTQERVSELFHGHSQYMQLPYVPLRSEA